MQTFLKSSALAIAAAAICLMLAVFVPHLVRPASSTVPPQAPTSEPRGNDDFTVSTTEELISSQTLRSPYAVLGSLVVLIVTYMFAYRRVNQRRVGSR